MVWPGQYVLPEGTYVVVVGVLDCQTQAAAFLLVAPHAECHLEAVQAVKLILDLREATEMQDETQKASATSSPDPLTQNGPQHRDIDVYHLRPNCAGSCGAWREIRRGVVQELLEVGCPRTVMVLARSALHLKNG